jgi:hypothetical protein
MGSKDDIVEADKTAGSYDKIMIADFVMSLSRKREDKIKGTGRVHVIKNRFGSDGMTYGAKINTANGNIEISENEFEEGMEEQQPIKGLNQSRSYTAEEKVVLNQKFFQLGI